MLQYMTRLAAGLALAALVSAAALAEPAPQKAVAIPPELAPLFQQFNLDKVGGIIYLDEQGAPIDEATFLESFKAKKSFGIGKKAHQEGLPVVTLRLQSKSQLETVFGKLKVGETMPEFHLKRLDGTAIDSGALKGRYTLVSFYFAECGPCVREVPQLNALAQRRKDVNLLAVTFDSAKDTREFVAKTGLAWPVVPGADKLTKEIDVRAYPAMALFDPQGRLVEVMSGGARLDKTAEFDAWLDKKIAVSN
jgi:peroxiredoxin